MRNTVVLDFDSSVRGIDRAATIPLRDQEEKIRFACSTRALTNVIRGIDFPDPPITFIGSGDFHHVSFPLIERLRSLRRYFQVVVFDNHPDNMRFPFGIHCASWVSHVSRLPFVTRVHVAGIASADVQGLHTLENRMTRLRTGKVVYWCVGRDLRWLRRMGALDSRSFATTGDMLDCLLHAVASEPIYISIDKDVLARDVVQTNWDQGVMQLDELLHAVRTLRSNLIGADVTGEVSTYVYRSRWKRMLSALDHQPPIEAAALASMQVSQASVNQQILSALRT